jgi:ABC transport system ATP-binding/permease protein
MSEEDMPRLVLEDGDHVVVLDRDTITVGRLPDNDIRLDDPEISRHHARFIRQEGIIALEDLGSSNGTFVNGTRIAHLTELRDGDSISFAGVGADFRSPEETDESLDDRLPQAALEGIGLPPLLLEKRETSLGRSVDNDLILDDPAVSAHHAVIAWRGDSFTLTDLGSANGTEVNGQSIAGPRLLEAGDEVRLGSTTLFFRRLMPARRRPG